MVSSVGPHAALPAQRFGVWGLAANTVRTLELRVKPRNDEREEAMVVSSINRGEFNPVKATRRTAGSGCGRSCERHTHALRADVAARRRGAGVAAEPGELRTRVTNHVRSQALKLPALLRRRNTAESALLTVMAAAWSEAQRYRRRTLFYCRAGIFQSLHCRFHCSLPNRSAGTSGLWRRHRLRPCTHFRSASTATTCGQCSSPAWRPPVPKRPISCEHATLV